MAQFTKSSQGPRSHARLPATVVGPPAVPSWSCPVSQARLRPSTTTIVVIIVAVIVVAALLVGLMAVQRRRRLQRRFGPEYDRLVDQRDSRLRAEAELTQRERRVRRLDIRPLTDEARARYAAQWAGLQADFVDRPPAPAPPPQVPVPAVRNDSVTPADEPV